MIANPVIYLDYDVRNVLLVNYLMLYEVITSVEVKGLHFFPGRTIVNDCNPTNIKLILLVLLKNPYFAVQNKRLLTVTSVVIFK